MSVQNEIQELEHQLELKKAYLNVRISFGKGYKTVPEDIRNEVQENLRKCAEQLAAGESLFLNSFSDQEILILKTIAAGVAKGPDPKTTPKPAPTEPQSVTNEPSLTSVVGKQAELLLLDSLEIKLRQKVESGSTVTILSQRSHRFYVEDPKGNRFWIPEEDLAFIG